MTILTSRRSFLSIAATSVGAPLVARAQSSPVTLRMGHVTAAGSVFDQGAKRFAELLEQKTGGAIKVTVFAGGQLGQEREVMEGMPLGIVDLHIFGTSTLTSIAPEIGDSDLPFLYASKAHADKCLEGSVGDQWLRLLEPRGIKGLGWGAGGFRSCLNSKKPIAKKEDFAGMKFRVAGGPVFIGMFKALGASAIQMNWGEVYTAVQQGVIDGLECPPNVALSSKLNEVAKFATLDEHTYSALVFGMADPAFKKLNTVQQKAAVDAGREAGRFMRDLAAKLDADASTELRAKGVRVDIIDKAPLIAAMDPVYKDLAKNAKVVAEVRATRV
jgi:tripartite ATP-independent transporter DctP family solute receptor